MGTSQANIVVAVWWCGIVVAKCH